MKNIDIIKKEEVELICYGVNIARDIIRMGENEAQRCFNIDTGEIGESILKNLKYNTESIVSDYFEYISAINLFEVGDELIHKSGNKCVVVARGIKNDDIAVKCLDYSGSSFILNRGNLLDYSKTGNKYPALVVILEQLKKK